MHRRPVRAGLALAATLVAACGTGAPEVAVAREVLATRPAEERGYRLYALSILSGSRAPHARQAILEAVAGADRVAAAEAIRGLERADDPETLAALRAAFSKSGAVKAQAAAVLARTGDAEAVEWLSGQLGQGGYVLPAAAMAALAETEHEEAVRKALRGLVWSKDLSLRNEGYAILGEIDRPWAVSLLLEGLDREFGEERVEPILALGRIGDPSAVGAIRKWVHTQGLVLASLEALGRLGDARALDAVEPLLEHEQAVVRAHAVVAAWRLGARDAARASIPSVIADPDPAARRALAEHLADAAGDEATAWLLQLSADPDAEVRAEAFRGLVGRPGAGLARRFAEGAQDASYEVATVALLGLAGCGDASHVPALGPLLESDNPYLAIAAAHAVLELSASRP